MARVLRQSRFNTVVRIDDELAWLYNSRSGAVLQVKAQFIGMLDRASNLSFSAQERLIEGGFVIDSEYDELADMKFSYEAARHSPILGLTICPTFACNLRCGYCYEGGDMKQHTMSEMVEDEIVRFVEEKGKFGVSVSWYGGEPLMSKHRVLSLQKRISEAANVTRCSMVTNGTMLTPSTYEALRQVGVGRFQITLDGTTAVHDIRRPTASGRGSFEQIVDNLRQIDADFKVVSLRVNLDRTNLSSFVELVRYFSEDEKLREYMKGIYPARVTEWPALPCRWKEVCFSEEEFSAEYLLLADQMHREFGLNIVQVPTARNMFCAATVENSVVVGPSGELYKCWTCAGDPKAVVGYVSEGLIPNKSALSFWRSWSPFENDRCVSCKHLPTCLGGCPEMARNGMVAPDRQCLREKYSIEEMLAKAFRGTIDEANAPH